MKRQGSGIRAQGSEPTADLLRRALPPIEEVSASSPDLWPDMLRKMRAEAAPEVAQVHVPWFDWVLAAGLAGLLAAFPAAIPVLLYYL